MAAVVPVVEKLAVDTIEQLAEDAIGEIIEAIKKLITNPKDNDDRSRFTQDSVAKATRLVSKPVNALVIFERVDHDASDLLKNGYKTGKLKCPCKAAGNTLLYDCYVGDQAATFHKKGDGGFLNWAISGKFNRHDDDVVFAKC